MGFCYMKRNEMLNFVFIAVLAVLLQRGRGEIAQRWAFFNTMENAKINNGDLIKRQRTQGLMSCTQQCLSEPLCASFNYDSSSARADGRGFCELYKDGEGVRLIQEPGWLCGHLHDKGKIVKPPAECKTWQTKDGECCVFPFLYRGKLRKSCVFDGELWCSVTKNYDIDKLRGACEDFNLTFTTLGTQGPRGPTNTSGYQGTTLQYKISLDNGIQVWKVPLNGSYVIEAWGASGAEGRERDNSSSKRAGGKGAYMKGSFNLTRGMLLKILVGQKGSVGTLGSALPGGGGGGTFVNLSLVGALIIAGGGGGGGAPGEGYGVGDPGQTTEKGSQYGGSKGKGGIIFEEGQPSASFGAGAGGGLIGDGESGDITDGGKSFEHGGNGGWTQSRAYGGFGGGGAGFKYPGAGGGYSGGGVFKKTGGKTIAGGGGSLNSGINQVKKKGVNGGDGKVVITLVKPEL